MSQSYRALVIEKDNAKNISHELKDLPVQKDLAEGHVEIKVQYSSLNYKDALSFTGHPGVTRKFPHVPGIDAAGIVLRAGTTSLAEGSQVIVTGQDLGMNTHGGLGERIIVPENWVVPAPAGLSPQEAMALGTAGFTAAQCVGAVLSVLDRDGKDATPSNLPSLLDLPIAISGATGGVGSIALAILHKLKLPVCILSRKASDPSSEEAAVLAKLYSLSAEHIQTPESLNEKIGLVPMAKTMWSSAIDTVGGEILSNLIKSTEYRGAVAACGMVAGDHFTSSVFPFILRGVHLIGIDSAACPRKERLALWEKLSSDWKPSTLDAITKTISLEETPAALQQFLTGSVSGRIVVEHAS